jgi:hypothetical protein
VSQRHTRAGQTRKTHRHQRAMRDLS